MHTLREISHGKSGDIVAISIGYGKSEQMAAFHLKMDSRETANRICMRTSRNLAVLRLYDVLDMFSNLG